MELVRLPRLALVLVAVITLFTVASMAAFWPSGATDAKLADSLQGPTYGAEVVGVRLTDCDFAATGRCTMVKTRLTDGPDEGQTVSFPTGASAGDPDFVPGDAVLLAGTGEEAVAQGLAEYSFVDYERRDPMLWLLA